MTSQRISSLVATCLAFVFAVAIVVPASQGQYRGFKLVKEWKCSRCGGLISRGEVRPSIEQCPHCTTKIRQQKKPSSTPRTYGNQTPLEDQVGKMTLTPLVFAMTTGLVGAAFWFLSAKKKLF